MTQNDVSIGQMDGHQLIEYLNTLSRKQAEYSSMKVKLTEELKPIEQARAAKRLEISVVSEQQRQVRIEIAACKYALKASAEGLN